MMIIGICGLVFAASSLLAGFLYFRAGRRPNQLSIQVSGRRLVVNRDVERLTVSFDGQTVKNPYLVTVRVRSDGPKDIRSTDFDSGAPLRVVLGQPILGEGEPASSDLAVKTTDDSVDIPPALLVKGTAHTMSYVVDGPPDAKFVSPLADTTVSLETGATASAKNTASNHTLAAAVLLATVAALLAMASSVIISGTTESNSDEQTKLRQTVVDVTRAYEQTIDIQQKSLDDLQKQVADQAALLARLGQRPSGVPAG